MSIPEKGIRSTANAHSLVENENQKHDYSEDASGAKPLPGVFEGKGENDDRVAKASKATAGRHVTSKDGLVVAKERSAFLEKARNEHQKAWDSDKKSVVPEQKGRKRK
jgi:hypothetical protein